MLLSPPPCLQDWESFGELQAEVLHLVDSGVLDEEAAQERLRPAMLYHVSFGGWQGALALGRWRRVRLAGRLWRVAVCTSSVCGRDSALLMLSSACGG